MAVGNGCSRGYWRMDRSEKSEGMLSNSHISGSQHSLSFNTTMLSTLYSTTIFCSFFRLKTNLKGHCPKPIRLNPSPAQTPYPGRPLFVHLTDKLEKLRNAESRAAYYLRQCPISSQLCCHHTRDNRVWCQVPLFPSPLHQLCLVWSTRWHLCNCPIRMGRHEVNLGRITYILGP